MTIKDIYNYVKSDWCGHCPKIVNDWYCPYDLDSLNNYCALDSIIIALDYLERGEYYG